MAFEKSEGHSGKRQNQNRLASLWVAHPSQGRIQLQRICHPLYFRRFRWRL